jgi:hypothetical protein
MASSRVCHKSLVAIDLAKDALRQHNLTFPVSATSSRRTTEWRKKGGQERRIEKREKERVTLVLSNRDLSLATLDRHCSRLVRLAVHGERTGEGRRDGAGRPLRRRDFHVNLARRVVAPRGIDETVRRRCNCQSVWSAACRKQPMASPVLTNAALDPSVGPVGKRLDFERDETGSSRTDAEDVFGHESRRGTSPVVRLGGLEIVAGISSVRTEELPVGTCVASRVKIPLDVTKVPLVVVLTHPCSSRSVPPEARRSA